MVKRKYDGLVVVEGKNDVLRLSRYLDADFIITGGLKCSPETIDTIREASRTREILIFTDPDSPGNRIRAKILKEVPEAKQAFLQKKDAIGRRHGKSKVGVEHADDTSILQALEHLTPGQGNPETLSWSEYVDLGLTGTRDAKQRRALLAQKLHIGFADGKTFFHRLNLIGVTKDECREILNG